MTVLFRAEKEGNVATCVAVLNMHLKGGTSKAFVERDENGICQIAVYNKATTEK